MFQNIGIATLFHTEFFRGKLPEIDQHSLRHQFIERLPAGFIFASGTVGDASQNPILEGIDMARRITKRTGQADRVGQSFFLLQRSE